MEKFIISGGVPLHGKIHISGAKNSALPAMIATLLSDATLHLDNIPNLSDVNSMAQLLEFLGISVQQSGNHLNLRPVSLGTQLCVPDNLMKTMRASVLVIGPLLARFGRVEIYAPGGDAIGSRPIDQHIMGFQAMGAKVSRNGQKIILQAPKGLLGAKISLAKPTVTGTENLMLAATITKGKTVIENASREPEISDLAELLITMGAKIDGYGSPNITIFGSEQLHGGTHRIQSDRIETGSYLTAAAITGGSITTLGANPKLLESVLAKLEESGADIDIKNDTIKLDMHGQRPKATDIVTNPYPGFPTDMQGQFLTLNCIAEGQSEIVENIFENRFGHTHELAKMGAKITLNGNSNAIIEGIPQLNPNQNLYARDLRASFSLILAALTVPAQSQIYAIECIDRGYSNVESKLSALGADIHRIST